MNRITCAVVVVSMCASCSGGVKDDGPVLTQLNKIATSAACPTGGVMVVTGRDWNGDGVLADDEVLQRSEVCNGTNAVDGKNGATGFNSVTATTMLSMGDSHCPSGGAAFSVGIDSGADGGIAGNGVLEPAEVQSTQYLCNGAEQTFVRSIEMPEGPPGRYSMTTNGGAATDGGAGNGGPVSVQLTGSLGGNVKVFNAGEVDAGFQMPKYVFTSGAQLLHVTSDLRITIYDSLELGEASGDAVFGYVTSGDATNGFNVLAAMKRDAGSAVVTSLRIDSGATLRFVFAAGGTLKFANDVENAGTLVFEPTLDMAVSVANFYGVTGSKLKDRHSLLIAAAHDVINEGDADFRGVDGGHAGSLKFTANRFFNAGTLDLRGGDSDSGGGNGGNFQARTLVSASVRGVVLCSGGAGVTSGGEGGQMTVSASSGETRLSGTLASRGGGCSGVGCLAGRGSNFTAIAPSITANATIDMSGGDGQSLGGQGGTIRFTAGSDVLSSPVGDTQISGNLLTAGGRGASGGPGGSIDIWVFVETQLRGQEIALFGYSGISTRGGSSVTGAAGNGGSVTFSNFASLRGNDEIGPTGAAVNAVDLVTRGGDGAIGGRGGYVFMGAAVSGQSFWPSERVVNSGHIDTSGGTGSQASASGGAITFNAMADVINSGTLESNGGGSMSASDSGRGATEVTLASTSGAAVNSGVIHASGGAGRMEGGAGADVTMHGATCVNTGSIRAEGGQSALQGGPGGTVFLDADANWPAVGTIDTQGGAASNPGKLGGVRVNSRWQ